MRRHFYSFHYGMMAKIIPARKRKRAQTKEPCTLAIRKYLVQLVSVNGRPLQIVNDSPMKEILGMAANSAENFSKRQLKNDIDSIADDVKRSIVEEIKEKSVSLLLDIVTKYNRSFLGVNIQYVHADKLILRTIGMINMDQSHTGAYISHLVSQLANEYGLDGKQI